METTGTYYMDYDANAWFGDEAISDEEYRSWMPTVQDVATRQIESLFPGVDVRFREGLRPHTCSDDLAEAIGDYEQATFDEWVAIAMFVADNPREPEEE